MRRLVALVLVLVAIRSTPALAWDPVESDLDPGPSEPTAPDPAPFVVPSGLYLVTDVYRGDVVTANGTTTTYSTATVREMPGTYARVIDVVGTGDGSSFDGSSFNGRARLSDGRPVAGTYYEDYVLTAAGFTAVNIVFFQDDSETHAIIAPTPAPVFPTPARPAVTSAPATATLPPAARIGPPSPTPAPATSFEPTGSPTANRAVDAPIPASAGVALAPLGPVLSEIEVIRGRTVPLWPRVFVGGVSAPLRTWHLVPGIVDTADRSDGTSTDPCEITWLTLAPVDSAWTVRFEVTTDAAPGRVLSAMLKVTVRSPALLQ
jgi:hypothetical protein